MGFGSISVAYPDGRQKEMRLSAAGLRIGSAPDNDLVVAGRGVAPHHAVIDCGEGFCAITDVGSSAGTLVDGVRLLINLSQELDPGAGIQIGDIVLYYLAVESAPEAPSFAAQPAARVPTTPLRPSDLPADLPDAPLAAEPPRIPTTPLKLSDLPADLLPAVAPSSLVQAVLPQLGDVPLAASVAVAGIASSFSPSEGPANAGAAVVPPPAPKVQTQPLKLSDLPASVDDTVASAPEIGRASCRESVTQQ